MNRTIARCDESSYARQLDAKLASFRALEMPPGAPEAQLFPSPIAHFRQRAEFRVWHEGEDLWYAMFDPREPRVPLRVDEFPPASLRINALMRELREQLLATVELRRRLFQVEFLSTLAGEALVTLIYHRRLDEAWQQAAGELERRLDARIIGRARRQRVVISDDFVTERLSFASRELLLRQPEGCFTQPNAEVNRAMLHWAEQCCAGSSEGALVELYCGIGNFTTMLAPRFPRVMATEINKRAIEALEYNLDANKVDNCFVARMAAHEVAEALSRKRAFRRLRELDLDTLRPCMLLVDPPRAGLDEGTRVFAGSFEQLIYISCNPQTLSRDIAELSATHRIERLALFDQFPYTPHLECGALLSRR